MLCVLISMRVGGGDMAHSHWLSYQCRPILQAGRGLAGDLMSPFNRIINVSLSIIKAIEPGEENELDVLVQNP